MLVVAFTADAIGLMAGHHLLVSPSGRHLLAPTSVERGALGSAAASLALPALVPQSLAGAGAAVGALTTSTFSSWQLLAAFVVGGAFSTSIFAAEGLRVAFGPKNIQRGRRLVALVLKRFWRVTITMLVAACVALVRGVNDLCHVDPEDPDGPEGCKPGGRSRWAGAWQILHEAQPVDAAS